MLKELLSKVQRGKPIQPPAGPPPLGLMPNPFELPVPYAMVEFPRTFLHLVKESKEATPQLKQMIETWLEDFEGRLNVYMHGKYGEGADQVREMISEGVMQHQNSVAEHNAKAEERDILADLEDSLKKGETGEGSGSSS